MSPTISIQIGSIDATEWLLIVLVVASVLYIALLAVNARRDSQAIPINDDGTVTQQNTIERSSVFGDVSQHNENETKLEQIERQLPSSGGLFPNLSFNLPAKLFEVLVGYFTKRALTWLLATGVFLSVFSFLGGTLLCSTAEPRDDERFSS